MKLTISKTMKVKPMNKDKQDEQNLVKREVSIQDNYSMLPSKLAKLCEDF